MICNVLCNLHAISNDCAKYERHWSKNEGGVRLTGYKLIYFTLCFDTNGKAVMLRAFPETLN